MNKLPQNPCTLTCKNLDSLNIPIPKLYLRKNVKEWNKTAIDCYNIGCDCSKCFIYETYFKDKYYTCKMKYYVQLMLNQLGIPKEENLY